MVSAGLLWYASYGSNMSVARLRCYIEGGAPPGSSVPAPGARDRRLPTQARPVALPGAVYFAESSRRWGGGGVGFYDPDAPGPAVGYAYLLTAGQFSDVIAQENGHQPGVDLDLSEVQDSGRQIVDSGWYGLVLRLDPMDGRPVFTVTSAQRRSPLTAPSRRYLQHIVVGLVESQGWDADRVASYLAGLAGVGDGWSHAALRELAVEVAGATSR